MSRMPQVKYDMFVLRGGWDQVTPTLSLQPGVCRDAINFECNSTGGYTRIGGYERSDGRPKPSSAIYQAIAVTSFTNVPTVGQTLTGNTSGATGVIIAVNSSYMVVSKVTGTFNGTEVVKVGATVIGTQTAMTQAISSLLDAQYMNLAADLYRADIQAIPGSGSVLGVVCYNDTVYGFRNNAGATAAAMYRQTAGGWSAVTFLNEISFTAGAVAIPADGATLTQGGVTATVRRVVLQTGAWTGAGTGRLIITNPAGGNFAAGAATLTGGATLTLSGVQTAITLAPNGKYEFSQGNFFGQFSTVSLYGADGVNRGFEFFVSGGNDIFVPVATGAASDIPKHVNVHKNHLFFSIASSLIYSGDGVPYKFLPIDGGGEIATGDTITNTVTLPGAQTTATMGVWGRSNTFMLYGTGTSSWNLVTYNSGTGGLDYTVQNAAETYCLDDRGVICLQTTLAYGNFDSATLTHTIKPFIIDQRSKVVYGSLNREKNQYRLFFNSGYGLYITIVNGKLLGSMPVYFPNAVTCAFEGELSNGNEITLFGSTNGYVYQLDVGSSFDGANIDAYLTLNWNAINTPRFLKSFHKCSLEISGNYYASVTFGYQVGYGSSLLEQPANVTYESMFQGAPKWDSFNWDSFVWDGRTLTPTECEMNGTAENVQLTLTSSTDYMMPYTINSAILHYIVRRGLR